MNKYSVKFANTSFYVTAYLMQDEHELEFATGFDKQEALKNLRAKRKKAFATRNSSVMFSETEV